MRGEGRLSGGSFRAGWKFCRSWQADSGATDPYLWRNSPHRWVASRGSQKIRQSPYPHSGCKGNPTFPALPWILLGIGQGYSEQSPPCKLNQITTHRENIFRWAGLRQRASLLTRCPKHIFSWTKRCWQSPRQDKIESSSPCDKGSLKPVRHGFNVLWPRGSSIVKEIYGVGQCSCIHDAQKLLLVRL